MFFVTHTKLSTTLSNIYKDAKNYKGTVVPYYSLVKEKFGITKGDYLQKKSIN